MNGGDVLDIAKAGAMAWVTSGAPDGYNLWGKVGKAAEGMHWASHAAFHGAVGGLLSMAQGGSFRSGFISSCSGQVKPDTFLGRTVSPLLFPLNGG